MGCCLDIVKLMVTVIRVKVTKQYYKYPDIEVTVKNYYEQSIEIYKCMSVTDLDELRSPPYLNALLNSVLFC